MLTSCCACGRWGDLLADAVIVEFDELGRSARSALQRGLVGGRASVPDAPPAGDALLAHTEAMPGWVSAELLNDGDRMPLAVSPPWRNLAFSGGSLTHTYSFAAQRDRPRRVHQRARRGRGAGRHLVRHAELAEGRGRQEQAGSVRPPHFEAMVFTYLAEELRSGDVAVVGSEEYADWSDQLLPWEVVEEKLPAYLVEVGLAEDEDQAAAFDAAAFRRQLEDRLRAAAAAADAGYSDNESLVIDPDTGIPSLKPQLRFSPISFRVGCGRPSTSSRACSKMPPRPSPPPCMQIRRASRCLSLPLRTCWAST